MRLLLNKVKSSPIIGLDKLVAIIQSFYPEGVFR